MTRPRPAIAIAVGGLAAGALDLIGAVAVFAPASLGVILRSIAAGLVGPAAARTGGTEMIAIGVLAHFTVACGAAAVFVVASRRVPALTRPVWLTGPLYGLAVFLVMNYLVIPWSAIGRYPGAWTASTWQVLAVHLLGVGPPIVLAARRWSTHRG